MYRQLFKTFNHQDREPPRLDVITRWNSTYIMIKESLAAKNIIELVMHNDEFKTDFENVFVTPEDFCQLPAVAEFLATPAKISTFLGGDVGYCTISRAIAANKLLMDHCQKFLSHENKLITEAAKKIMEQKADYGAFIHSTPAKIAQFVDPRSRPAMDSLDFTLLKSQINNLLDDYSNIPGSQEQVGDVTEEAPAKDNDELMWLAAYPGGTQAPALGEVERFVISAVADLKCDIIEWWASRQADFPNLSRLALDYLAIPASSVPAERANSAAGRAFNDRARLHSSTFRAGICSKSWIVFLRGKKSSNSFGYSPSIPSN